MQFEFHLQPVKKARRTTAMNGVAVGDRVLPLESLVVCRSLAGEWCLVVTLLVRHASNGVGAAQKTMLMRTVMVIKCMRMMAKAARSTVKLYRVRGLL